MDVTTIDLGRDIGMLQEVSRSSGVQIICATGTWLDIPRVFWRASPDMVASLFIREITQGIENTGVKAGIIKVANDIGGVTREGEIILRAAARAQKATSVPISTHTWAPERVGDQQVRIFEDEGLDLDLGVCRSQQRHNRHRLPYGTDEEGGLGSGLTGIRAGRQRAPRTGRGGRIRSRS